MRKKSYNLVLIASLCTLLVVGCGKVKTTTTDTTTADSTNTASTAATIEQSTLPILANKGTSLVAAWHYDGVTSLRTELHGGYKYEVPAKDGEQYSAYGDTSKSASYIISDFTTKPSVFKVACGYMEKFNFTELSDDKLNEFMGYELTKLNKTTADGIIKTDKASFYVIKGNVESTFSPQLLNYKADFNLTGDFVTYSLYFKCPSTNSIGIVEIMIVAQSTYAQSTDANQLATVYDIASHITIN